MVKLKGKEDHEIYFGASANILRLAGELRKNQTHAEKILWHKLRNRQISGYKFRRQHPINIFIADFYCHEARLVIEVDGPVHNSASQSERDTERDYLMTQFGITTLRFSNKQVENEIENVLQRINHILKHHTFK
ncbi:MAG: endonuclease domain-containing protein [Bacteroidales bacterium]|jgi:very-short-patch-repair endonuclease|nr:endonuclease domain-containing protein [Bacteroidales bacterium]